MKETVEIFMFIDALGWELVERTQFLSAELPVRRPMRMQFGYSCSAIPSILSGTTPAQNGHLSYFNYDPKHSPFKAFKWLRFFLWPRSFWERGRIRHWLSKLLRPLLGFTGYFQLYSMPLERLGLMDYAEKKDLFGPKGLEELPNLYDVLCQSGLKFHISDWHRPDAQSINTAEALLKAGETDFIFLYTAQLDAIEHEHVKDDDPAAITRQLEFYARRIKDLLAAAEKSYKAVHFTVISDHGMTPLTRAFDIKSVLEKTGLVFGEDYISCIDSTLLRVYYLRPDARQVIEKALYGAQTPGHWLSLEEEERNGIRRADRKFGDSIFLADPGVQFAPSDMGKIPLSGMHGYDPDDKYSVAAMLTNTAIPEEIRAVPDYFRMMKQRIAELQKNHGGSAAKVTGQGG